MRSDRPPLRPIIKNRPKQQLLQHSSTGTHPMSGGIPPPSLSASDRGRPSPAPAAEGLTVDCGYSVAHSTVSYFSVGFKSNFDWLFTPSSSPGTTDRHHLLSDEAWKDKEERIRQVLAGDEETGVVDLWQLRELALSPGGLLTPFLRKQAWPKLVGCHVQVLRAAGQTAPTAPATVVPSSCDVKALEHDVSKTIWSVEEHLLASREQEKLQEERLQQFLAYEGQRGSARVVRFAPHTRDHSCTSPTSPPPISRIDSNESHTRDGDGDENHFECGDLDKTTSFNTVSSHLVPKTIEPPLKEIVAQTGHNAHFRPSEEDDSLLSTVGDDEDLSAGGGFCPSDATHSTTFTLSSRVVRWRKASIAEQKILYNVVLSILRTEAEPSENFEDDRYHYFSGLQDLTALLMINLESPSLTSLVLTKLAGSHLRDALRKDRIVIDTAIAHAFMPLLERADPELYQHLRRHGMTLPAFCRQWISCWFAQDVPDVEVASRLLDAFLVGHPLLPLYASVALLIDARSQILQCTSHLSTLYSLLRGLPVQLLFEQEHRQSHAETVVATALQCMKDTPPAALVDLIRAASDGSLMLDSIAMFRAAPTWSQLPHAPSDYALLKKAQELRMGSGPFQEYGEDVQGPKPADASRTPLAFTAMGYCTGTPAKRERNSFAWVLVLCILTFGLSTAYFLSVASSGQTIRVDIPSMKAPAPSFVTGAIATTKPSFAHVLLTPTPVPYVAANNTSTLSRENPDAGAAHTPESHYSLSNWLPALVNIIQAAVPTLQVATPATTTCSSGVTSQESPLPSAHRFRTHHPAWIGGFRQVIQGSIPHSHI